MYDDMESEPATRECMPRGSRGQGRTGAKAGAREVASPTRTTMAAARKQAVNSSGPGKMSEKHAPKVIGRLTGAGFQEPLECFQAVAAGPVPTPAPAPPTPATAPTPAPRPAPVTEARTKDSVVATASVPLPPAAASAKEATAASAASQSAIATPATPLRQWRLGSPNAPSVAPANGGTTGVPAAVQKHIPVPRWMFRCLPACSCLPK